MQGPSDADGNSPSRFDRLKGTLEAAKSHLSPHAHPYADPLADGESEGDLASLSRLDRVKQRIDAAKHALSPHNEHSPMNKVGGALSAAKDKIHEELDQAKRIIDQQREALRRLKEEKAELAKQLEERMKERVAGKLAHRLDSLFEYVMAKALIKAKEAAKDPYMFDFVKNLVDDFVESIWPDVKSEAREIMLAELAPKAAICHGSKPCVVTPRAWARYMLFPYDRTIWRKLRDPFWWVFTAVSAIPRYGVPEFCYLLVFLIIDKRDEFQLLQFITNFKALQFVSLGVLSAMIGSLQYYICTTEIPESCSVAAPQEQVFTLVLFVAQAVLVWLAFLLSFFAKKKGGRYHQLSKQAKAELRKQEKADRREGQQAKRERIHKALFGEAVSTITFDHYAELEWASRRRMLCFLIYDLIVFGLCAGLVAWCMHGNLLADDESTSVSTFGHLFSHPNWRFTATLYWVKALYGLLSFPFLLLVVPGIKSVVSHARPTGYNPWGKTVPYIGVEEAEVPWPRNERALCGRPRAVCADGSDADAEAGGFDALHPRTTARGANEDAEMSRGSTVNIPSPQKPDPHAAAWSTSGSPTSSNMSQPLIVKTSPGGEDL
jgi:flagellin-specific chaperone FliS